MTASTSSNLRIGEIHSSPSLGSANLTKEEVGLAIDALIKKMAPARMELIAKIANTHDESGRCDDFARTDFGRLKFYPSKNQKLDETKYGIAAQVKIKDVKENDDLDRLLIKLSKRLSELGYTDTDTGRFDINFEKGILETHEGANFWHHDLLFKTAITTCFSSKKNWNTQIVDENKMPKETKDLVNDAWKGEKKMSREDFRATLESFREHSQHGFLYDALNVFHRAPKQSDLGAQELDDNDYRFFIRYTEDKL